MLPRPAGTPQTRAWHWRPPPRTSTQRTLGCWSHPLRAHGGWPRQGPRPLHGQAQLGGWQGWTQGQALGRPLPGARQHWRRRHHPPVGTAQQHHQLGEQGWGRLPPSPSPPRCPRQFLPRGWQGRTWLGWLGGGRSLRQLQGTRQASGWPEGLQAQSERLTGWRLCLRQRPQPAATWMQGMQRRCRGWQALVEHPPLWLAWRANFWRPRGRLRGRPLPPRPSARAQGARLRLRRAQGRTRR